MPEEEVGVIVKFFAKPSVAAVKATGPIRVGDRLHYHGATTDFEQDVTSMEVDNQSVEEARAGDLVGIQVKERVRENDTVYKVT